MLNKQEAIAKEISAELEHAYAVEKAVYMRMKSKFVKAQDIHGTPLTETAIDAMALLIAKKIQEDVASGFLKNLLLISLMDGAFDIANRICHHLKALNCPFRHATLQVSSYNGIKSGELSINSKLKEEPALKDIVLIDDLVDKAQTMYLLEKHLQELGAKSVHVACLIDKKQARKNPIEIRYPCYTMHKDAFIVGAGMDYKGMFRNERDINVVDPSTLPAAHSEEERILDSIPKLGSKLRLLHTTTNRLNKILQTSFPFYNTNPEKTKRDNLPSAPSSEDYLPILAVLGR